MIGGVIYQTKFWLRGSQEWNASHAIMPFGHACLPARLPSCPYCSSAQTDVVPKRMILYRGGREKGGRAPARRGAGGPDRLVSDAQRDKWQWRPCHPRPRSGCTDISLDWLTVRSRALHALVHAMVYDHECFEKGARE